MVDTQPRTALPAADASGLLARRYRLGPVLGRGGMSEVLRAEDTLLGRDVAIKLFFPAAADAADPRRHSGEITLLAALNHPGLVTLFEDGLVKAASGLISLQEVLRDLPRIGSPRPLTELRRILGY